MMYSAQSGNAHLKNKINFGIFLIFIGVIGSIFMLTQDIEKDNAGLFII